MTQALAESAGLEDASPKVLQAMCEHLDWQLGTYLTKPIEFESLRRLLADVPAAPARRPR